MGMNNRMVMAIRERTESRTPIIVTKAEVVEIKGVECVSETLDEQDYETRRNGCFHPIIGQQPRHLVQIAHKASTCAVDLPCLPQVYCHEDRYDRDQGANDDCRPVSQRIHQPAPDQGAEQLSGGRCGGKQAEMCVPVPALPYRADEGLDGNYH